MAGDQAPHQGRSVPHRPQRHHLEGGDPQLLRADDPDACEVEVGASYTTPPNDVQGRR